MISLRLIGLTAIFSLAKMISLPVYCQTKHSSTAALRFLIVDTFGNRLKHFEVILENTEGDEFRPNNPLGRFTQKYENAVNVPLIIPFGLYKLTIVAPGFQSASIRLHVDKPQMWIPVGLSLGNITPYIPKSSLTVTVSAPADSHAVMWTKALEIFSDRSTNVRCDERRQCLFSNLRPGQYMILLFDGGKLLSIRSVNLHVEENFMTIGLSDQH